MSTAYPGAIDSFTIPGGSEKLGLSTPTHTGVHQNQADSIVAVQTELGTNPKGASASVAVRLGTLAVDSAIVHLAGTETITGQKGFALRASAINKVATFGGTLDAGDNNHIAIQNSTKEWTLGVDGAAADNFYVYNATGGTALRILGTNEIAFGNAAPTAGNGLLQLASGTTKANGMAGGTDAFLWRQSAGMWGVGDSSTGGGDATARHGFYFGQGGYQEPGAYQTDVYGDKLTLYRGDGFDGRVGVGTTLNLWYLAGTANAGGGRHEFYTAASSGSATLQDTVGHNTRGFFGTAPVARPTGFGTPTGVARMINFPGATATLGQTSGAVADIITFLKAFGLVAA